MSLLANSIDFLIYLAAAILIWGLIAFILIQILIQFEIIPRHNQPARLVWSRLGAIYEPLMRPFRRYIPVLGGFDLSPLVLVLVIYVARSVLIWIF